MRAGPSLTPPNLDYVEQRIREFDELFGDDERTVGLVLKQWRRNTNYPEVLIKTIVVNQLYSTHIIDVRTVAKHIVNCNIDDRLHRGDVAIVAEIARVQFKGKPKESNLISFATKYCSWHEPERYQIFDSLVEELLWKYQKQFGFSSIGRSQFRNYPSFLQVVNEFRTRFALTGIGLKDLDKFLWIEGRSDPDQ